MRRWLARSSMILGLAATFLDAPSNLYKRVCPSVRPSVSPSVRRSAKPSLRRLLGASCAEYSALFMLRLVLVLHSRMIFFYQSAIAIPSSVFLTRVYVQSQIGSQWRMLSRTSRDPVSSNWHNEPSEQRGAPNWTRFQNYSNRILNYGRSRWPEKVNWWKGWRDKKAIA